MGVKVCKVSESGVPDEELATSKAGWEVIAEAEDCLVTIERWWWEERKV
jgi:hypothetical protein